ncbi:hypothetical protein CERZMDRAFT_99197 [Cercospora zeae-maydis SCOH1-5]|uniref:Mid2 domain-containing protein n=1 Tax=Cercospora zeae-maydis SCOH1-5 TaxID=717836 RepID=A0A6A6FAX0_9PEZI|nr:hypothetical protein CERZMDRAFT_99197 [Cercospora zeae-maydis SCOH1-5]
MAFWSRLCEIASRSHDDGHGVESRQESSDSHDATDVPAMTGPISGWIQRGPADEEGLKRDVGDAVLPRRQDSFQEFVASKHSEAVSLAQAAAASEANAASGSVADVSVTSTTTSTATDAATTEVVPSPLETGVTTASAALSSQTARDEELSASSVHSGGLSQGSKIGLGVGLGLGIPLLLAAIVFLCLMRRRRRKTKQMGAKYTRQAQSDLSMVEQSQSVHPKTNRAFDAPGMALPEDYPEQEDAYRSETYYRTAPPPAPAPAPTPSHVLDTPSGHSVITAIEPTAQGRDQSGAPLTIAIPGKERKSDVSRDVSPPRSHSPVSPVSSISAVSPVSSRPSSPKAP